MLGNYTTLKEICEALIAQGFDVELSKSDNYVYLSYQDNAENVVKSFNLDSSESIHDMREQTRYLRGCIKVPAHG